MVVMLPFTIMVSIDRIRSRLRNESTVQTDSNKSANDYSHIADPNLRRRLALSEIDKVPFGYYHIRTILVAGVGFFLDSYDIFAINLITSWLGLAFWSGSPEEARYGFGGNYGTLPTPVNQALKASTSAGIVLGMVLFGWLADAIGRRRMYGIELIIIMVSTLMCALVSPSQSMNSTGLLILWRVMMVSLYTPLVRNTPRPRLTFLAGYRYWRRLPSVFSDNKRVS